MHILDSREAECAFDEGDVSRDGEVDTQQDEQGEERVQDHGDVEDALFVGGGVGVDVCYVDVVSV